MKYIYLVRHGESMDNVDNLRRGPDSHLTPKGVGQATITAKRFKDERVDVIYSSTYKRAQDTARIIADAKGLEVSELPMIHERVLPERVIGQDRHDPKIKDIVLNIEKGWVEGREYSDQAESYADMLKRSSDFYETLRNMPEEYILVVSHGFFLRFFITHMLVGKTLSANGALSAVYSMHMANTGITHITIDDSGKFYLKQWNDDAHLGELR